MKKLLTPSSSSSSSYSSSPSSSSTLSFNSKSASAGCLTAILNRILFSGGLQTHPSDQIRELDSMAMVSGKVQEFKAMKNSEDANTTTKISPGIVGRLMGLDSMGEIQILSEQTPSSVSRSRSMNSANYLGECKIIEGLHRPVKSSSSSSLFGEAPTFHLLENEKFLVLSFESGCDGKELKSRGRRKGLKKEKRGKVSDIMSSANVGNDGEVQFANMKCKEATNGEKVKKRKKGTACYTVKKVESECSSEDLSPVSVFDFEREAPGTEVDFFGDDVNWRRKLSPELENNQLFVLHSDGNLMNEEMEIEAIGKSKHEEPKKKEKQIQEFVDIWGEICSLVEDELVGSNQLKQEVIRKQGDFESISADLESEIFDHLLNELVDQLVNDPMKTLQL